MKGVFQSLFSWKSPSDFHPIQSRASPLSVSILVFVEVALGHKRLIFLYETILEFQSLFSWKSPSDTGSGCSGIEEHLVSILVFVEVALGHGFETICTPDAEFQSLFSWKSPSDWN